MKQHLITKNRKGYYNYSISDELEAGIVLEGYEVKSIRNHDIHINESYAIFKQGELWLINSYIEPYRHHTQSIIDPTRNRKLLLHKKEIIALQKKVESKQLSLIPIRVYIKQNKVKISIGIGTPKKKFDKRQSMKLRDTQRDIEKRFKFG